jgi:hypothetical protein
MIRQLIKSALLIAVFAIFLVYQDYFQGMIKNSQYYNFKLIVPIGVFAALTLIILLPFSEPAKLSGFENPGLTTVKNGVSP